MDTRDLGPLIGHLHQEYKDDPAYQIECLRNDLFARKSDKRRKRMHKREDEVHDRLAEHVDGMMAEATKKFKEGMRAVEPGGWKDDEVPDPKEAENLFQGAADIAKAAVYLQDLLQQKVEREERNEAEKDESVNQDLLEAAWALAEEMESDSIPHTKRAQSAIDKIMSFKEHPDETGS